MAFLDFLPLIGNVVSGISNLFGNSSTNDTNREIARETNEQNYKMFQEQLAFTEDMWNKNNEYNTPAAQRQRFEEAGINPYMAVGQMQGGNATMATTPTPNSAQVGHPMIKPNFDFVGESFSAYQDARMKEQQIEQVGLDNKMKAIELMYKNQSEILRLDRERQSILESKSVSDVNRKRVDELSETIDSLKMQNRYLEPYLTERNNEQRSSAQLKQEQVESERLSQEYQKMITVMDKKLKSSQIHLNTAQVSQCNAVVKQVLEEVNQMKLNGVETRQCQRYARQKMRQELLNLGLDEKQAKNTLDAYNPYIDPWINRIGKIGGFVLGVGGMMLGRGFGRAATGSPSVPSMTIQRTNPTLFVP